MNRQSFVINRCPLFVSHPEHEAHAPQYPIIQSPYLISNNDNHLTDYYYIVITICLHLSIGYESIVSIFIYSA